MLNEEATGLNVALLCHAVEGRLTQAVQHIHLGGRDGERNGVIVRVVLYIRYFGDMYFCGNIYIEYLCKCKFMPFNSVQ